ncbi:hypothetical protein C7T94_15040 [Pedobacter yulinensis]|uniref:Uncharacterized protein n=1 Tax=Pedobacter yulinensis TaxID=2126353 RepID=A0A2T3HI46_9SPHI|nr:hypothetical protein C7T94_15040 [Pedobacter yulinensis]
MRVFAVFDLNMRIYAGKCEHCNQHVKERPPALSTGSHFEGRVTADRCDSGKIELPLPGK